MSRQSNLIFNPIVSNGCSETTTKNLVLAVIRSTCDW